MNEIWPRAFAYSTGVLMLGAFFYVASHSFFTYIEQPGLIGWLTLLGFAFAVVNVCYMIGKRYSRRLTRGIGFSYVLGVLFVLPTMIQLVLNSAEAGVVGQLPLLFSTLVIAAETGVYLGIQKGAEIRKELLQRQDDVEVESG